MHKKHGFTLIELLITISILAILVIGALFTVSQQRAKAENARIKSYLARLKIAFEEYHNDNGCYPPAAWFDDANDCDSDSLSPYLNKLQCNKKTGLPYAYETDPTGCKWFKFYATFDIPTADPDSLSQYDLNGSHLGNYGVSSSNVNVSVYFDQSQSSSAPSSTPLPSGLHTFTYCSPNCTVLPPGLICTPTYVDNADCDGCMSGGQPVISSCHY